MRSDEDGDHMQGPGTGDDYGGTNDAVWIQKWGTTGDGLGDGSGDGWSDGDGPSTHW